MTRERWIIVGGLALGLVGYGVGRYAQPAKVITVTKTETQVEWKDREVVREVAGPVRTVTRTVERLAKCPEGGTTPTREITIVEDRGPVVTDRASASDGTAQAKAEVRTSVVAEQPRLALQAGAVAGADFRPTWNAGASYRLAGPLWLGAAYHSDKRLEVRAMFTF